MSFKDQLRLFNSTEEVLHRADPDQIAMVMNKYVEYIADPLMRSDMLVSLCANAFLQQSARSGENAIISNSLKHYLSAAFRKGASLLHPVQSVELADDLDTNTIVRENAANLLLFPFNAISTDVKPVEIFDYAKQASDLAKGMLEQRFPLETTETYSSLLDVICRSTQCEPWSPRDLEKKIKDNWLTIKTEIDAPQHEENSVLFDKDLAEQATLKSALTFYAIGLNNPLQRIPMMNDIFNFAVSRAEVLRNNVPAEYSDKTNAIALNCLAFFVEYGHPASKDLEDSVETAQRQGIGFSKELSRSLDGLARQIMRSKSTFHSAYYL